MSVILYLHPRGRDLVGFIPDFLHEADPRTAQEQFEENYSHGGGWRPMKGWKTEWKGNFLHIRYPGDPTYEPVAVIPLHDQRVFVYPDAWVAVVDKDGTIEISRLD